MSTMAEEIVADALALSPQARALVAERLIERLDELFRITLGMWNYAKNHNPQTVAKNRYIDGQWKTVAKSTASTRRTVLRFAPVTAAAIRIISGAAPKSVVLCEVRIY